MATTAPPAELSALEAGTAGTSTGTTMPAVTPLQTAEEKGETPQSLSSQSTATKQRVSIREFLMTHVDPEWTWIPLIFSSFTSGLNDSSAFAAWGTFTDMQTGNTVFLALGASQTPTSPPFAWLKAMMAIIGFLFACFTIPRIQRLFTPAGTTRIALFISWFIQGSCLMTAAALVQAGVAPEPYGRVTPADMDPTKPYLIEMLPIALMAIQAGGQITTARMLGFNEIPTVVLTSAYCDLVSDVAVFKFRNAKRDRRVMSVVALLIGGICGGWLCRSSARMSAALWLGGAIKLTASAAFLFWKAKPESAKK